MDEKMPGDRFIETLRGLRDGKTLTRMRDKPRTFSEGKDSAGRR